MGHTDEHQGQGWRTTLCDATSVCINESETYYCCCSTSRACPSLQNEHQHSKRGKHGSQRIKLGGHGDIDQQKHGGDTLRGMPADAVRRFSSSDNYPSTLASVRPPTHSLQHEEKYCSTEKGIATRRNVSRSCLLYTSDAADE